MFAGIFGLGLLEVIVLLCCGFLLVALAVAVVLIVYLSQKKGPGGPKGPEPG
jgi:hypothetical protein